MQEREVHLSVLLLLLSHPRETLSLISHLSRKVSIDLAWLKMGNEAKDKLKENFSLFANIVGSFPALLFKRYRPEYHFQGRFSGYVSLC